MAKLRRLRIERFRGVAPGTELAFNDTFNVLLGQNGTGKTTLLKLIAMAFASNFEALAGEDFSLEYEIESIGVSVVVSVRNDLLQGDAMPGARGGGALLPEGISQAWSQDDPTGIVAFHVDGDRRWAERASSENFKKSHEFVSAYVRPAVLNALRRKHQGGRLRYIRERSCTSHVGRAGATRAPHSLS